MASLQHIKQQTLSYDATFRQLGLENVGSWGDPEWTRPQTPGNWQNLSPDKLETGRLWMLAVYAKGSNRSLLLLDDCKLKWLPYRYLLLRLDKFPPLCCSFTKVPSCYAARAFCRCELSPLKSRFSVCVSQCVCLSCLSSSLLSGFQIQALLDPAWEDRLVCQFFARITWKCLLFRTRALEKPWFCVTHEESQWIS